MKFLPLFALLLPLSLLSGKEKKLGFSLPTYPQSDKEQGMMQHFILSATFEQVAQEERGACTFSFLPEGQLFISGKEEEVESAVVAFGTALEEREEWEEEHFALAKARYLERLSTEEERRCAAEVLQLRRLHEVSDSLASLPFAMQTLSPSTAEEVIEEERGDPQLFHTLPLSEEDKKHIYELIDHLGGESYLSLWAHKGKMTDLGKKIKRVHPLRFLHYVLSQPHLKEQMKRVQGDNLKWSGFLHGDGGEEGFGERMTREMCSGNMLRYLAGFACAFNLPEEAIQEHVSAYDWEGLISYLLFR